jgi:hypothetical protein
MSGQAEAEVMGSSDDDDDDDDEGDDDDDWDGLDWSW